VAGVQYTFTHKEYTERHKTNSTQNETKNFGRVWAVPRLCELYPGICLTTNEKAWENLTVRAAEECKLARWKQNIQNRTNIKIRIYKNNNKNT
jgi:hypothetical protein